MGRSSISTAIGNVPNIYLQNLSDWLRRMFQARSATQRIGLLRKLRPSDIRLFVPEVKNRVTGRSMGEHTEDGEDLEHRPSEAG